MTEHEQHADRLDDEVENLEERSDRLQAEIADTREDWERKKADDSVPGAPTPTDDSKTPPPEAEGPG